jgi:hypothetical protein
VAPEDDDGEGAHGRNQQQQTKPAATRKPDPAPQPQGDQKPWAGKFRAMFEALGQEKYSQILGAFGYERAADIPDQLTAKKVIDALHEAVVTTGAAA